MRRFAFAALLLAGPWACGNANSSDPCKTYYDRALLCTNTTETATTRAQLVACQKNVSSSTSCEAAVEKVSACFASNACSDLVAGTACDAEQTAVPAACPQFAAAADPNG